MTVTYSTEHRPPARAAKPGCRRDIPTQPEFEVHLVCKLQDWRHWDRSLFSCDLKTELSQVFCVGFHWRGFIVQHGMTCQQNIENLDLWDFSMSRHVVGPVQTWRDVKKALFCLCFRVSEILNHLIFSKMPLLKISLACSSLAPVWQWPHRTGCYSQLRGGIAEPCSIAKHHCYHNCNTILLQSLVSWDLGMRIRINQTWESLRVDSGALRSI